MMSPKKKEHYLILPITCKLSYREILYITKQVPFHQNNPFMQGCYNNFFQGKAQGFHWGGKRRRNPSLLKIYRK